MKYFWGVLFFSLMGISGFAQSATTPPAVPTDTTAAVEEVSKWEKSWVLNLVGNQVMYRDWSEGGVNSLAYTTFTLFRIKYNGTHFSNSTRMNLRFGQTRLEDSGFEKTEDLIRISNKTQYLLSNDKFSAFAELAFRTQFARGFDPGTGDLISDFMSPGFVTESVGIEYEQGDYLSVQLGLASRQTFVWADPLDGFYGLGEDEDIRSEGGITFILEYEKEIFSNFVYRTEINTFSNLLLPVSSTDMIMFNQFRSKINSFMTTTLGFDLMYDNDFADVLQMKTLIAVGFNFQIL